MRFTVCEVKQFHNREPTQCVCVAEFFLFFNSKCTGFTVCFSYITIYR